VNKIHGPAFVRSRRSRDLDSKLRNAFLSFAEFEGELLLPVIEPFGALMVGDKPFTP
jgi:hypothetical protein